MRRVMMVATMAVFASALVLTGPVSWAAGPPAPIAPVPQPVFAFSWFWGDGTRAFDGSIHASGQFINVAGMSSGEYEYNLEAPVAVPPEFAAGVPGGKLQNGSGFLTSAGVTHYFPLVCNPYLRQCLWQGTEFGQAYYSKHWYTFPARGGLGTFTEVGHFYKFGA